MAKKTYKYIGNAPEIAVPHYGIVKKDEPFVYEGELNNPDFEEVKEEKKKEK